mgnify:CR=1 FL=1
MRVALLRRIIFLQVVPWRVVSLSEALAISLHLASSVKLLTGRERLRIECVCLAIAMQRGYRDIFQRRCQAEEKLVDAGMLTLDVLHHEHHASLR